MNGIFSEIEHYIETESWKDTHYSTRYHRINDPCIYCGKKSESWDHLDPLKGKKDNLDRACHKCNGDKASTPSPLIYLCAKKGNIKRYGFGYLVTQDFSINGQKTIAEKRRIAKLKWNSYVKRQKELKVIFK